MRLSLFLGIKRSRFRDNDPRRKKADAEFAAKRPGVLSRLNFVCQGCGYTSKTAKALDVHHLDDDHHNNDEANLCPSCHTCHPYQHVGELARRADIGGEGLGRLSLVASIGELSARDVNLLQRALGVALLDEKEAPVARKIIRVLADRASWVKGEFGSFKPGDFAAAMYELKDDEYAARGDVVHDLRLLFSEAHLKKLGSQMLQDYPAMPISAWAQVAHAIKKKNPDEVDEQGGVDA